MLLRVCSSGILAQVEHAGSLTKNAEWAEARARWYCDKQVVDANNPAEKKEDRDAVNFEGPTDSVYLKAPEHVELDVGTGIIGVVMHLLLTSSDP